jgi:tetratricopeptide (TPR) repeat protein
MFVFVQRYLKKKFSCCCYTQIHHLLTAVHCSGFLLGHRHILAGMAQEYDTASPTNATDTLYQLRGRIPSNEYRWLCNVDHALANLYLKRGEYRRTMACLDRIVTLLPSAVPMEVSDKNMYASCPDPDGLTILLIQAYTCEIYSRQGRILLQIGALSEAADIFESAKQLSSDVAISCQQFPDLGGANKDIVHLLPCQMEVNEGLFYFSKSHFNHALQSFTNAVQILMSGTNTSIHSQYQVSDMVGPSIAGCSSALALYHESINNMALSHLYMCNIKDAIDLLEGVVREDPTLFLTERVAFNLCTLYELGWDIPMATRKKKMLQLIAKRFFLHDIGPESFRGD